MTRQLVSALVLALCWMTTQTAFAEVQRFALLIAANDGGPERPALRFAESDARAMGQVLQQMGGVERPDEVFVLSAKVPDVDRAFDRIRKKLEAARAESPGARLELIAYYSGHSDEYGLLLGGDHYGYPALRKALEALPADVRILVLDSCASGAIIRNKGGERRASFLIDESSEVQGQAIVTSSSIDQAAQESDDIGGSYFTHFLVSGLRGAADRNGDSRVTLSEAYAFAFANTLQATSQTIAGPQHAGYDFQLRGFGDVVLTMFTPTTSALELADDVVGQVFVWRDQRLEVEVPKAYGDALELGLPPGRYTVTVAHGGNLSRADIKLVGIGRERLARGDFRNVQLVPTVARGGSETIEVEVDDTPRRRLPWYRHALLGGAVAAGATTTIALLRASAASSRADELVALAFDAQGRALSDEGAQYIDAAAEYFDDASVYRSRAQTARTVAIVAGGIGATLLLTEFGFRVFGGSPTTATVGLAPTGIHARFTFY